MIKGKQGDSPWCICDANLRDLHSKSFVSENFLTFFFDSGINLMS